MTVHSAIHEMLTKGYWCAPHEVNLELRPVVSPVPLKPQPQGYEIFVRTVTGCTANL